MFPSDTDKQPEADRDEWDGMSPQERAADTYERLTEAGWHYYQMETKVISDDGRYWSTGIMVRWFDRSDSRDGTDRSGWGAHLKFYDDGFANSNADQRAVSTEGTLRTRYFVQDGNRVSGLSAVVDALLTDALKLGIRFLDDEGRGPYLDYSGAEDQPPPDGWRVLLSAEAARIGWRSA